MGSLSFGTSGLDFGFTSHEGSCPEPFDALNGHRLAGPQGSHPLHAVRPEDLLRPSSDHVTGEIVLDGPARVGDGIEGTLRIRAIKPVNARKAALRLVGLRLVEEQKSKEHRIDEDTTRTEYWVEANGSLFTDDAYIEPVVPATLAPGQEYETRFMVPAPRLGPPSAHLGEAIVAWALDVRWDIAMGDDAFLALLLPVAQHPDLIRAGVGKQGGMSLLDTVDCGEGATIHVGSQLPATPGSTLLVRAAWPKAPGGNARIELHRRTNAPNATEGVIASVGTTADTVKAGSADVELHIPEGVPPSFDGAGLENGYVIRVLVDRRFMPDAAIERPVAVV
jgi:hypothetical protein